MSVLNRVSTRVVIPALAAITGLAVPFGVSAALRDEPAQPPPVADPFPLWHSAEAATEPSRVLTFRGLGAAAPMPTMGRAERGRRSSPAPAATVAVSDTTAGSRQAFRATDTARRAATRVLVPARSAPAPVRVAPVRPAPAPSASPPVRSAPPPAAPRQPSEPRFDSADSFDSTG